MDGDITRENVQIYSTMLVPTRTEGEESKNNSYPLSDDGRHRVLPEQGRKGVNRPAPINLDCWPAYRDKDEDTAVFFAVYNPVLPRQTTRDLHWARTLAAWRQIHIIEEKFEASGDGWESRYVYWGPLTKSSGPTDDVAKRYSLGVFSLERRKRIEELAAQIPVMVPDGTWNCQDWLLELFERMVAVGLIPAEKRDEVLAAAGYAPSKSCSPSRCSMLTSGLSSVMVGRCMSSQIL
ncbi:hypothetical protein C8T65DRAFT_660081 [Cerioporus squamosus]|nr:hypothetical protein C8T65DRAFT_660081 [Cerioporus squamosus]